MSRPAHVHLFVTCLHDTLFPEVAQSVVDVLELQGVEVDIPIGQTCCGQPAFNAGYWDEARILARRMIDVLGNDEFPVVVASGSCAAMVIHYYTELFSDDPIYRAAADRLAARLVEFTQFLVDVLGVTDQGAEFNAQAAYHPSCHALRGMGIDRQPRTLLSHVKGLKLVDQADPETCCGFGGLFAVKMPDISGAILEKRLRAFEDTGVEYVIGCDSSCLMHIEGGLRKRGSSVRTLHIAQILAGRITGTG